MQQATRDNRPERADTPPMARIPFTAFHNALDAGACWRAAELSERLPYIGLIDSLRLTLLGARVDPEHFDRRSRDWIARAIEERAIAPHEVPAISAELEDVRSGRSDGAYLIAALRSARGQPR